jgi:hypothetical protein
MWHFILFDVTNLNLPLIFWLQFDIGNMAILSQSNLFDLHYW